MPAHDWTRVDDGLFHLFHVDWTVGLYHSLNAGLLPQGFYALVEYAVAGECELPRQRLVAIRANAGDRLVAVIEIISRGNKASEHMMRDFVRKKEFLARGIHFLMIDLHPPTPRDPAGLHNAIWQSLNADNGLLPADKPLTAASFDAETGSRVRAYVVSLAVGEALPTMPLFLLPGLCVQVPLEPSYTAAYSAIPWARRRVLEPPA